MLATACPNGKPETCLSLHPVTWESDYTKFCYQIITETKFYSSFLKLNNNKVFREFFFLDLGKKKHSREQASNLRHDRYCHFADSQLD